MPPLLYLIQGHYYVMDMHDNGPIKISHCVRVKIYPMGGYEMMAANREIFSEYPHGKPIKKQNHKKIGLSSPEPCEDEQTAEDLSHSQDGLSENLLRAMRRARSRVRDLALSNHFRWFVTLTLSPDRVDRYDMGAILKVLNRWLDNRVRRDGLKYLLVPERHKDGAIHFHGFFNDAIAAVPSGHCDAAGHQIFNLPTWSLGFTAAIEVYGDYPRAVSYVCKYIGKQGVKPAGRWFYSGGDLAQPTIVFPDDLDLTAFNLSHPDSYMFRVPESGLYISIVRSDDLKGENF